MAAGLPKTKRQKAMTALSFIGSVDKIPTFPNVGVLGFF
jgi:hypothetical protein